MDLFTITPSTSYLVRKEGMANLRTVAEILQEARVKIGGRKIASPVQKVMQDDKGRLRLSSTKEHAKVLLEFSGEMVKLYLLLRWEAHK